MEAQWCATPLTTPQTINLHPEDQKSATNLPYALDLKGSIIASSNWVVISTSYVRKTYKFAWNCMSNGRWAKVTKVFKIDLEMAMSQQMKLERDRKD